MQKVIKVLLLSLSLSLMFTGCVTKDTKQLLSAYSKASVSAQKSLMQSYDENTQERHAALYAKAVRDGASVKELKGKEINYQGQKAVLNDLINFTDALMVLTGDDTSKRIDENSAKLYESAKRLSQNNMIDYDAEKELKLFASLVNGAMRGYSEYSRYENAKELMLLSDKWVAPAIKGLNKGLSSWKKLTKRALSKRKKVILLVLNNPYTYCQVQNANKKCVVLAETYKTRFELYKEVALIQERLDNLDKEYETLSNLIISMSTLHQKVISSLEHDEINYDSLSQDFYLLKEQAKALKKFKKAL